LNLVGFSGRFGLMKKLLFKNAQVVSSQGIDEKDVVVSGGEILKVCEEGEGQDLIESVLDPSEEYETIDCSVKGKYLIPGVVDAHVHFREPGLTHKGDFASESEAALAGGVTTIFDMPNTKPATITYEAFAEKVGLAKVGCKCNFKLFFGATDEASLVELKKVLADEELVRFLAGIKVYMGHSTGGLGASGVLEMIMVDEELREVGGKVLPLVVHAEDQACLDEHEAKYDPAKPETHGEARPVDCCVKAVKEVCDLARKYDRPVHVAHVSSREELDVVAEFRDDVVEVGGAKVRLVTCEVSPRHLFLNDSMYDELGMKLKVNPPVRSKEEAQKLWEAVLAGEIDIVATDHSPHTLEEKDGKGSGGMAPSGMPDVQTLLPLLLNEVVREKFDMKKLVEMCCERPAELFGLEKVGKIEDGFRADLVLVNLREELVIGELKYKCGWSCYEGWKIHGGIEAVVLGGEILR